MIMSEGHTFVLSGFVMDDGGFLNVPTQRSQRAMKLACVYSVLADSVRILPMVPGCRPDSTIEFSELGLMFTGLYTVVLPGFPAKGLIFTAV